MTVSELKEVLGKLGLPTIGKKAELVARHAEALALAATGPEPAKRIRTAAPAVIASSSSADAPKFERLTPVEHVLRRPGMYIGSTSVQIEPLWVHDAAEDRIVWRDAQYIPGLYKIFDEILVNALDNVQRDPAGTNRIDVAIEPHSGRTSVWNNGRGIPVRRHETEGVWLPEMLLGSLFTGSNFDDEAKRTVGGRHGFGAKLTNLFSTAFEVQTADTAAGVLYTQRWAANMSERTEPTIEPLPTTMRGADFTKIVFTPDLTKFGVKALPEDMLALFRRRVYDAAATAAPACVSLDGRTLQVSGLQQLAQLYTSGPHAFAKVSERWHVGACLSPTGAFQALSFVNGVATPRAGTHVAHVCTPLLQALAPALSRALKLPAGEELTPARLKPHLMLFVDCKVDNPEFDSQSKEALTSPPSSFGGLCTLPDAFIKRVAALEGLRTAVAVAFERRATKELARRTGPATSLLEVPKLEDAELAGGPSASECTLIVTEGDSAKALAVAGLEVVGRERYGVFPLRGKPLNVREISARKVGDNEELTGLMRALGLTPGASYEDQVEALKALSSSTEVGESAEGGASASPMRSQPMRSQPMLSGKARARGTGLRYGRLMLMADQDTDGSHIKGLVISMLHHFWPELLHADFVQEFQTPLLKARRISDGQVLAFFSLPEYEAWHTQLSAPEQRHWRAKYYKGLGTSTAQEAREYFGALGSHRLQLEWASAADDDLIDMAFSKKRAADRREWMLHAARRMHAAANAAATRAQLVDGNEPPPPLHPPQLQPQPGVQPPSPPKALQGRRAIGERRTYAAFVNEELVQFSLADVRRSLPSAIDGLKPSQRKVLYACFAKRLLPSAAEMKVAQLAGFCAEVTHYHHGEASMHATITNMAQGFVGSNNVPLLEACGQFGTRAAGGSDAASARYIFTRLTPLAPLLFPAADAPILTYCVEDGHPVEPLHYVPVLPTLLLNGASGIGTGWSTQCWSYHPVELLDNVLALANGRPMAPMVPWAAGFRGEIVVQPPAHSQVGARVGAGMGAGRKEMAGLPSTFLSRGAARLSADGVEITELPLGR